MSMRTKRERKQWWYKILIIHHSCRHLKVFIGTLEYARFMSRLERFSTEWSENFRYVWVDATYPRINGARVRRRTSTYEELVPWQRLACVCGRTRLNGIRRNLEYLIAPFSLVLCHIFLTDRVNTIDINELLELPVYKLKKRREVRQLSTIFE